MTEDPYKSPSEHNDRIIANPLETDKYSRLPIFGCAGGGCLFPILFMMLSEYLYSDLPPYDFPQSIPFVIGWICWTIALLPIDAIIGTIVGWAIRVLIEAKRRRTFKSISLLDKSNLKDRT